MGYIPEEPAFDFDENQFELVRKISAVDTEIGKLAAVVSDIQDDIRILVQRQMQIRERLEKGLHEPLLYAMNKG